MTNTFYRKRSIGHQAPVTHFAGLVDLPGIGKFRWPQSDNDGGRSGVITVTLGLRSTRRVPRNVEMRSLEKAAWRTTIRLTSLSQLLLAPRRIATVAMHPIWDKR